MEIWFLLRILFSLTFAISGLFAVSLIAKAFFMTYRRDMLLLLIGFVLLIASIISTTVLMDIFHLYKVFDEVLAIAYLMGTAAFFLINASFFTRE